MKYKPDWPETQARLSALWKGEPTDRPCIATAVSRRVHAVEKPADHYDEMDWGQEPPATAEARWLDVVWVTRHALGTMVNTWWGGEAIPSYLLMAGWLASLGGRPQFDLRTIWFDQFPVDFAKPHPFHHNPADPWYQKFERLYLALAKTAGKDDFLLGGAGILPAHDLLSMHMGTQNFLFALMDEPKWMRQAIVDGASELLQVRRDLRRQVERQHDLWYGNAGWMAFWAPTPYLPTQSDVSCMLSPELFEEFVIPELDLFGQEYDAMWYHLDGSDALQHLPRLLSLPYLRAVQYVPRPTEPPNGVAHLKMYRQIQDAGRIVHVQVTKDQVEPMCRALDPRRLMLEVSWLCETPEEAQELLESAKRWTSAKFQSVKPSDLVARTHAAGGLAPVNLEKFWADQQRAVADPFGADIPQVPIGVLMGRECVFDELGIPETPENWHKLIHDAAWYAEISRAYNDKAERIVGRRLLSETMLPPQPKVKMLHDIFEARYLWHNESYWLEQSAHSEDELQHLLDRVDKRLENLPDFLAPGPGVSPYRAQRGPVTFATSIYGVEPLIYLILDNPDLAGRFRDTILRAIHGLADAYDKASGHSPHGFSFFDDNSCLLTAEMYEFFGYPILKSVFEKYAPNPGDRRYQHSDSPMGHLLPILGRLNFTGVNFGPTLTVTEIRQHMPRTVIEGQLAPFTLSRNEEEKIVREFIRDFDQARTKRGLVFATAGSCNNGSRLTGMRLIMAAIQEFGRYS